MVGDEATIIDTAIPVAMEVKRKLHSLKLATSEQNEGIVEFWTSGDAVKAMKSISELWDQEIDVFEVRDLTRYP